MAVWLILAGNGFLPGVEDPLLLGEHDHGGGVLAFIGVVVFTLRSGDVIFMLSLLSVTCLSLTFNEVTP